MRTYGQLLRTRHAPRLLIAATFSRLTTSMFGLAVLLVVVDILGSYAGAGVVLTGHAFGLAFVAPVTGRLADRYGGRIVLLVCLTMHAAGYGVLMAALGQRAGIAVVVTCAVAIGASNPPSSAVTRAQWPLLFAGKRLQAAYAADSVLNSSTFVVGPLIAGGLAYLASPYAALIVAGITKIAGDALLATSPMLGRASDDGLHENGPRPLLGPLADPQLRLLLIVAALDTFMHGSLQVGAVARVGGEGSSSLLLSALSAGEVLGGLAYGARRWPGTPQGQLIALHLGAALVLLAAGGTPAIAILVILYVAAGLVSGGRDALNQIVIGENAARSFRTEAFALLGTFMWLGYGLGTAAAGQVESHAGTSAIYMTAMLAGLTAALISARFWRPRHRIRQTDRPAGTPSS